MKSQLLGSGFWRLFFERRSQIPSAVLFLKDSPEKEIDSLCRAQSCNTEVSENAEALKITGSDQQRESHYDNICLSSWKKGFLAFSQSVLGGHLFHTNWGGGEPESPNLISAIDSRWQNYLQALICVLPILFLLGNMNLSHWYAVGIT